MFNSVGLNESPMVFLQSQYLANPTPDFYKTYYELSSCVPTDSGVGIRGFWRWEAVKFGKFLGRRDNRLVIVKTMRQELSQVAARLRLKHSNLPMPDRLVYLLFSYKNFLSRVPNQLLSY